MSLHVLNAGTGYLYYTSEIASGDELRAPGRELGDYYHAHGLPPGVWLGSAASVLGLKGNVTEAQMALLYGEGKHPDAERIVAEKLALGWTQANAERAAKLGRAYYQYQAKDTPLAALVREREAAFQRMNHRPPSAVETRNMRSMEAAILFRSEHGRSHESKEELGRFITSQLRPQQEAVAGFDLTMTPVKSVSVLWALGGEQGRTLVEKAQNQAVRETLAFIEENAIATRTGANGIAQEDVISGVVAASFRHYDSRNGDPNIHDHMVIANKVQDKDGHWKTVDSKLLHRMAVTSSEYYNYRVQTHLEAAGIEFTARATEGGKQPIMEIAGIPAELNTLFSSRSEEMKPVLQTLVDEYESSFGIAPDPVALLKLAQAANLETRPDKGHGKSLEEHTTAWHDQALGVIKQTDLNKAIGSVLAPVLNQTSPRSAALVDVEAAAEEVMATVSDKRSTWSAQHVEAEAIRWAKEYAHDHGTVPESVIASIVTTSLAQGSVQLTPVNPYSAFKPLERADGASIFEHKTTTRYTSHEMIRDENLLVRAGTREVIPAASATDFAAVMNDYNLLVLTGEKYALDPAQVELAREFATSSKLLSVGVGAAGTGKSTVMALVKDTVEHAGGRVIALGPSAAAAAVLGKELDAPATTLDRFALIGGPNGSNDLKVTPGTVVIIDEAGMAGTKKLAHILDVVESGGGVVRLVGDTHQHGAVQAGGALALLVNEVGAIELDAVHRFRNADGTVNQEEADASLALRTPVEGEANPFQWYLDNGRIQAGDQQTVEALAYSQWQERINAGEPAVIMAPVNDQAQRLSEMAQNYMRHQGRLDTTRAPVTLRDQSRAWVGDTVVTRRNNRELQTHKGLGWVRNGDLWEVTKTHRDGSLSVVHQETGGKIRLPQDYVQAHVHLGYAYTGNRAQGMTKYAGIDLADSSITRAAANVGLTRGKYSNQLFLELAPGETLEDALGKIAANHGLEESAHTAIASEYARMNNLDTMGAQYRHVNELANRERIKALTREVLGEHPAKEFIAAESFGAVATHLTNAEAQGWDIRALLQKAHGQREFESALDKSAVLAWRIQKIVEAAPKLAAERDEHRPLAGLTLTQLKTQLATAEQRETRAEKALSTSELVHGPHPATHWSNRRYGNLTDSMLEGRLAEARREYRVNSIRKDADIPGKPLTRDEMSKIAWDIKTLSAEVLIRSNLDAGPWMAETAARGSSTHSSRRPLAGNMDRLWQSRAIAGALREELRYRANVPQRTAEDAKVIVFDRLPEWIAPARALTDSLLPEQWKTPLQERRTILAARFNEHGHQLALEPLPWTEQLGPVPALDDLNQQWRDTAAEIAAFRALYMVPASESTPIPERFREQGLGAELHARAAATATSSHNATPATLEQLHAGAAESTRQSESAHLPHSPAQEASEAERRAHLADAGQHPDAHRPDPEAGTDLPSFRGPVIAPPRPTIAPRGVAVDHAPTITQEHSHPSPTVKTEAPDATQTVQPAAKEHQVPAAALEIQPNTPKAEQPAPEQSTVPRTNEVQTPPAHTPQVPALTENQSRLARQLVIQRRAAEQLRAIRQEQAASQVPAGNPKPAQDTRAHQVPQALDSKAQQAAALRDINDQRAQAARIAKTIQPPTPEQLRAKLTETSSPAMDQTQEASRPAADTAAHQSNEDQLRAVAEQNQRAAQEQARQAQQRQIQERQAAAQREQAPSTQRPDVARLHAQGEQQRAAQEQARQAQQRLSQQQQADLQREQTRQAQQLQALAMRQQRIEQTRLEQQRQRELNNDLGLD